MAKKKVEAPPAPKKEREPDLTVSELSAIVRHNLAVNLLHPAPETDEDDEDGEG
jgi:hypothetical protein